MPPGVAQLKDAIRSSDGLIICTPECACALGLLVFLVCFDIVLVISIRTKNVTCFAVTCESFAFPLCVSHSSCLCSFRWLTTATARSTCVYVNRIVPASNTIIQVHFVDASELLLIRNLPGFFPCSDNGMITPLLLNALTWCSRGDDPMYATFKGKVAAVLSASPGPLGGMRAHASARAILQNLGVTVLPMSVAVGGSFKAFGEAGELVDERQRGMAASTVATLVKMARSEANYDQTCELVKKMKEVPLAGEYGAITACNLAIEK